MTTPVFLQGFEKLPLSKEERVARLASNRWPQGLGLDPEELVHLAEHMIPYRGTEGAVVFRRGDEESFMCLINSGGVQIFGSESRTPDDLIATLGPENTVGEMALIDGEPRSAFAYAASETVLFVMTRSNFVLLSENYPAIWGKLLFRIDKLMSHRLRKTNEILEHLHLLDVHN